jgi:hypothetical protein
MQLLQLGGDQTQTMTSKEIAELTGKNHADVMRDIRNLQKQLGVGNTFALSEYKDSTGRTLPMYELNKEQYTLILEKYKGLNRVPHRLQEESALKTIEQLLGTPLIRQFKVGRYRIDGYDNINNIAYEIDEPQHGSITNMIADEKRENEIKAKLNCIFRRIKL